MRKLTTRDLIEDELAHANLSVLGPKARFRLKLPKRPKEDEEEEDSLQESRFGPGTRVDVHVPIFFSAHVKEEWYDTEDMLNELEEIDYGIKERVAEFMRGGGDYSTYRSRHRWQREDESTFEECPNCGEGPQEDDDYACCAGEPCANCGYDPTEEDELAAPGDWDDAFEKWCDANFGGGRGAGWQRFLQGYGADHMPMRYIGDYDVDEGEVEMILDMIQEEWNSSNEPDPDHDPEGEYTWPNIIKNFGTEFPDAIRNSIRECVISDYKEINGTPGVVVTFVFGEVLSPDDLQTLRDWVIGQGSDGFGEGFEQREIKDLDSKLYNISIHMFSPNQRGGKQIGLKSHEVDYDSTGDTDYPPVRILDVKEVPSDFKTAIQSMKGKLAGLVKKTGDKIKRGAKTAVNRVRNAGRVLQGKPPINTESLVCELAS